MTNGLVFALNIIGGLGLFLYGLKVLSQSLQKASSEKLKGFFEVITKNKLMGVTFGALVTSILQSSSATTVILVGFANAGVIGLAQSISIIFGANIGTTITAQIIAFKATNTALPLIGIGSALFLFSRDKKWKSMGEVILGLGILFLGLKHMSSFLKPLRDIPAFSEFLVHFGSVPLLGIIAGTIVTVILQSSSATTAMIITLAALGLIDFKSAFCLELGSNIGTTITAQIAAVGTNKTARRTAWAHTLFNVMGSLYMLILLYIPYKGQPIFLQLINHLTPGDVFIGENLARHCANAHTFFNVVNTIILFPFIGFLAKATEWIIPGKIKTAPTFQYIDERMLGNPPLALTQAIKETTRMAEATKSMSQYVYHVLYRNKKQAIPDIESLEDALNRFQDKIIPLILKLDRAMLTQKEIELSSQLIHAINRIERIGDYNILIINDYLRLDERKKLLSKDSTDILAKLGNNIQTMFTEVLKATKTPSYNAEPKLNRLLEDNQRIDDAIHMQHIEKMQKQDISSEGGIIFIEMISNYRHIANHICKLSKPMTTIGHYVST